MSARDWGGRYPELADEPMSSPTTRTQDWPTLAGIGVVALAAAVLSFASLQQLAQRAGFTPSLAALLPLAIDAQAVVATRAWLAQHSSERARRYARGLALASVGLSVLGNAGEHAMAAYTLATPWWVVVLVSAVPPAALAATVHLAALLAVPDRLEAAATIEAKRIDPESVDPAPSIESTPTVSTPSIDRAADRSAARKRGPVRSSPAARRSIGQLRTELAEAIASDSIEVDPGSAESIRTTLRCSPARARQLRDEHTTRPTPVSAAEVEQEAA
ncbi:MAG: DUF2637 domain-containing protein [Haloechinothrix sp.]